MIASMHTLSKSKQVKALGLLSGGLDSILAAKIVKDLDVEVYGIHFAMPWDSDKTSVASEAAAQIGIKFINIQLDNRYLKMIQSPKYGYGSAFNPCIDCHTYMIQEAAKYLHEINADFIFTGEVLGQRPMSQTSQSLKKVEKGCGLEGRLLRPLSAQLLDPTIPEDEGLIDRSKLLKINGRSRQEQIQLAQNLHITRFKQPAGGCQLTDKNFGNRIEDFLKHPYQNFQETIILKWGRHFRLNDHFKAIIGRNEKENDLLSRYARPDDKVLVFADEEKLGPLVLLTGNEPSGEIVSVAGGIMQRFSKYKNDTPLSVKYWLARDPNHPQLVIASKLDSSEIKDLQI